MRILAAITLSDSSRKLLLIRDKDEVIFDGSLEEKLSLVLEKFGPFKDQIAGIAIATDDNFHWLVDGLIGENYLVFLSTEKAIEIFGGQGYLDGRWDRVWLAKKIAPGRYSGEGFYLARYDSRLPFYLAEHVKTFRRAVIQSFGAILARQFDNAVNSIADQHEIRFHIVDGRIKMWAHSLSADHCRVLVKVARAHALRVVGTYRLISLIEETDHQYLSMNEEKTQGKEEQNLLEDGLSQLGLDEGF